MDVKQKAGLLPKTRICTRSSHTVLFVLGAGKNPVFPLNPVLVSYTDHIQRDAAQRSGSFLQSIFLARRHKHPAVAH